MAPTIANGKICYLEIPATDIEAVEVYETLGSVPFEFTPQGAGIPCGTIVIWTRLPGT